MNAKNSEPTYYEAIIVGGGPAGVQAAVTFKEKGISYVMIERASNVGSHWRKYPRHRGLISINKKRTGRDNPDFNLRHDWNSLITDEENPLLFGDFSDELYPSADDLLRYMEAFQERHQLNGLFNTTVEHITKNDDDLFEVHTDNGVFTSTYLFVGTGGKPWKPPIPGIDLPGIDTYDDVTLDKSEFENKRVLILGKGNSALETAEHICGVAAVIHLVSPQQIQFAWNTHYVGDLRAVRNNILDMYQLKSQHAIINGGISKIELAADEGPQFTVTFDFTFTPEDPCQTIRYDRIIACTGFKYLNMDMFDHAKLPLQPDPRPELKGKFPKITPCWQFVGIPNMHVIGSAMQVVNYRKNAGGFIHGFRYTIRTLINILMNRDRGQPLPHTKLAPTLEAVTEHLLFRMNTSSALYQMYHELCDVIVEPEDGESEVTYYYELPLEYVKERFAGKRYIAFIFDFGSRNGVDAFKYVLEATPETPEKSVFLHPILLAFDSRGEIADSRHLLENLETEWIDQNLHVRPIREFAEKHLLSGLTGAPEEEMLDPVGAQSVVPCPAVASPGTALP